MRTRPALKTFLCLALTIAAARGGIAKSTNGAASGTREGESKHVWKWVVDWENRSGDPSYKPREIEQSEMRMRDGDDPRWAQPGWDDSKWTVIEDREHVVPKNHGISWVRVRVRSRDASRQIPAGVTLVLTAARQFFWDGIEINRDGIPGNDRASETPGLLYTFFEIPNALRGPGEHVMAIRFSSYHFNRPDTVLPLYLSNVDPMGFETVRAKDGIVPAMAVGATLTMGLAAFVMWLFAARRPTLLLFTALCACAAATVAFALARIYFPLNYSWSYPLWCVQTVFAGASALCLAQVVAVELNIPWRRWIVPVLLTGFAVVTFGSGDGFAVENTSGWWRLSFALSFACAVWAVWRRRPGAWFIAAGIAATAALHERSPLDFLWGDFLPAMLPTIIGLLIAVALRLRAERIEARQAKLTAARMEIELLKKSLQPHFLMNTLTALAETIEENPVKAVALIDDLALEFRAIAHLAGERSISLAQEIELCRAHLRVMSVRTDRPWKLECVGVDPESPVPPALFLTLIENSFSHQQPVDGATTFKLAATDGGNGNGGRRYVFVAPGKVRQGGSQLEGGTGMRYVRARLEETAPGRWRIAERVLEEGWETTIELGDARVTTEA